MTTHDFLARVWEMLIGRFHGPLTLRLVIQPSVAAILAIRAGLRDAREHRPPYFFWAVFTTSARRHELFQLAWKDIGKVFIIACILDVTYEIIVYRWVYPGQVLIIAAVLAIIPYLVLRGPVTRIARRFMDTNQDHQDNSH
jgi:hypothetical protein